jgi:transposase-like protein
MPRKRHKPEEIVAKLRQVDVLVSQGKSVADAVRKIGVTEVTYYRWRQEFGGLKSDQVKRMKDLEAENTRPRRAVSDLTLDKMILAEAAHCGLCAVARAPPRRDPKVVQTGLTLRVPNRAAAGSRHP